MARLQISMDDTVLERVDSFAKTAGLTRSAFLSMAALDYINAKEKAPVITSAFSSMAALLDAHVRGQISRDDMQAGLAAIDQSIQEIKE